MVLSNLKSIFNEEKIKNKLNFLDGFRGTLALWVLAGHTKNIIFGTDYKILSIRRLCSFHSRVWFFYIECFFAYSSSNR